MDAFKIGDRIRILPRFARLYPDETAVIVAVLTDPIRSLFNEYTIEFPDGSTTGLFHFQIDLESVELRRSTPLGAA
jgi:hypothetical protein